MIKGTSWNYGFIAIGTCKVVSILKRLDKMILIFFSLILYIYVKFEDFCSLPSKFRPRPAEIPKLLMR